MACIFHGLDERKFLFILNISLSLNGSVGPSVYFFIKDLKIVRSVILDVHVCICLHLLYENVYVFISKLSSS